MSSKTKSAKGGKSKAKAKPKAPLPPNTGYRVITESYPSGRGCYYGQDLDEDYVKACTVRRVVGVYATNAEAVRAARAERDSDCQFDEWGQEYYGDRPPPYYTFDDDDANPDDDEDTTICIEDVAKEHRVREAKLAQAKASKSPARKKNKTTASAAATSEVTTYATGTKISRDFDGKPFAGEVVSYDANAKFYKIRYEDGDEEEMTENEIKRHLVEQPKADGNDNSSATSGAPAGKAKKDATATSSKPAGPRIFGPQKGNFKPDENRFLRNPCRIEGGTQNLPGEYGNGPSSGKSSFEYLIQRLSDRNYAMRGLCLDGDGAKYTSYSQARVVTRCLAFLPSTDLNDHAKDDTVVDAIHLDLINPKTGESYLTGDNFLKAVSPGVECIFLNSYDTKKMVSSVIVEAIDICKDNLKCFSITEGIVTKEILSALAKCLNLRGLTLSMTKTHAGDADLAPIITSCPDLRWLFIDETSGLFRDASWQALLNDGACPNLEILWVDSTENGDGRRNVARGDHDLIRRALNARKDVLRLCMVNPDTKLESRYVIGGAKKTDRLNGEKVKNDFMFGGW